MKPRLLDRKKQVDRIVQSISHKFRTFGGGQDSDMNPLAHFLKDHPLQFAACVDVRAVVKHVIAAMGKKWTV